MNLDWLYQNIAKRQSYGMLRSLTQYDARGIDFFSNDYLGLSTQSFKAEKNQKGSTGSRLISGNTAIMQEVEQWLANYYQFPAGLMFQSGYMANMAIFSALPTKHDTIIYDQYVHASTREGIRLSYAKNYSFIHNDIDDLETKIQRAQGKVFVAIEGLYSMDGDSPDTKKLINLITQYNLYLIVDEAHSVGVLGATGKGWTEGIPSELIFCKLVTFGKAFGYHGALILTENIVIENLINFAKPFIYTTALPEQDFIHIQKLHKYLQMNWEKLSKPLHENIQYFRDIVPNATHSPIQIIENIDIKATEQRLLENNIWAKAIYPPTVPQGKERLRITLHNFNTLEEITNLVDLIYVK